MNLVEPRRNSNLAIFDDRYKPSERKNIYENILKVNFMHHIFKQSKMIILY